MIDFTFATLAQLKGAFFDPIGFEVSVSNQASICSGFISAAFVFPHLGSNQLFRISSAVLTVSFALTPMPISFLSSFCRQCSASPRYVGSVLSHWLLML